jgi:hypothetical protein
MGVSEFGRMMRDAAWSYVPPIDWYERITARVLAIRRVRRVLRLTVAVALALAAAVGMLRCRRIARPAGTSPTARHADGAGPVPRRLGPGRDP